MAKGDRVDIQITSTDDMLSASDIEKLMMRINPVIKMALGEDVSIRTVIVKES